MTTDGTTRDDFNSILKKRGYNSKDFEFTVTNTYPPAGQPGHLLSEYTIKRISKNISRKYGKKCLEEFEKDLDSGIFGSP